MSLICAISNETPEAPVISPASGCIFERRLIEKYIRENGQDPVNNEKLTVESLIDIKTPPLLKPRPPTATSIPAILKLLQDEWDAVMLNNYALRQQLQTARQELSHTLYQHDAACRVIARLTKEVTAAREALATLKPQTIMTGVTNVPQGGFADVAPAKAEESQEVVGMGEDIVLKLQEKASLLTAERKKRGKMAPENLVTVDDLKNFKQVASHVGLHSASMPGILCLDICQRDSARIVTGGMDKNAVVFNKDSESVVAILQGHTKRVTNVIYHPTEELVISSSQDASIRVWSVQKTAPCAHVIRAHEAPVTGLSLHATGDYVLSSSSDGFWAFSDIRQGRVLTKVSEAGVQGGPGQGMTCAKFHPDGLIFGTGTDDSVIKIWDLKENTNVANFTGHQGAISNLAFSENGYYLATSADDGVVKLWDLRKLKNFKNITLEDRYEVKSLAFDQSGSYLVVTGTDIKLFLCKQWQELRVFNDHTALATDACFGANASFLASVSMDRTLKIFSQ